MRGRPEETVNVSETFGVSSSEEFNTFTKLFRIQAVKGVSNGHTFGTVFYYSPQSRYTLMQRVAVAWLFICGVFFCSAFFYQTDGEKTVMQIIFVALISTVIVTVVTSIAVLLFRAAGSRRTHVLLINTDSYGSKKFWLSVFGFTACTAMQIFGCYYVLLLSFDWGVAESWEWLGTIGLVSCTFVDLLCSWEFRMTL